MLETTIFLTGMLLFLVASTLFPVLNGKKKKELTSLNMMISFITLVSYAVMFAQMGAIESFGGNFIYPTRWLFYIGSCSLLMYEVGKIMKKKTREMREMIFFNIIVMLTGYLASITLGAYKWVFFSISTAAFLSNLWIIHTNNKKETEYMNNIKWYVTLTWTLFPIVWVMGPTGIEILNAVTVAVLYLLSDILTKVVFGYYVINKEL